MSIEQLKDSLPDYAKDIKLNFSSLLGNSELTEQQLWGCFLSAALASRNAAVIKAIHEETQQHLNETALNAVKAANAIMAMNNIYYRFTHLASNKEYTTMAAGLRMNVLANHGVDKADFEMWSLVVSAIHGCSACMDAHEKQLLKHGLTLNQVQTAVKIAAVVHAVATILENEAAL